MKIPKCSDCDQMAVPVQAQRPNREIFLIWSCANPDHPEVFKREKHIVWVEVQEVQSK